MKVSKRLGTFILILYSAFVGNHVFGINYFVSIIGNDTNNGLSVTSSFASITKACGLVNAGDTIFVRGGTYSLTTRISISRSGTSIRSIALFLYPGDSRPVLDFSSMPIGSSNQGISFSGSYWHVKGLIVKGAGDNGMKISGGNYNIIEFCDFLENRDSGLQLSTGSHDNRIINCDSYHNADYVTGSTSYTGGNADGFSPKMDVGSGNYFYGCRAWLNSDDGWDGYLRGTNNVTTTLENCWTWGNGYLKDGKTTTSNMNGNGFKLGGSDTKDLSHSFVVKNCLAFYNKANGFDQNSNAGSITIYNGTAISNGKSNIYLKSSNVLASGSVFTVSNSISVGASSTSFRAGVIYGTNQFAASTSEFVSIDSLGVGSPRKQDGSLPDITFMHLKSSSTMVDAGTDLGLPYSGLKPDLGCFETAPTSAVYNLSSTVIGNGTVSPSSGKYYLNTSVTLLAVPAQGYKFDNWSGDVFGYANPLILNMTANKSVTANFSQNTSVDFYGLSLTTSGIGSISETPIGTSFPSGTSVILTATAGSGYKFDSWAGDTSGTTNPLTLHMNRPKAISARFVPIEYCLTTNIVEGNGTILPASGSKYITGTTVTLNAVPALNYSFVGWGGDVSGTQSLLIIMMDANKSVTASFKLKQFTLNTGIASGYGLINPASSMTYNAGTIATIVATPGYNYLFDKWTDGKGVLISNSPSTDVTMLSDTTVKAYFKLSTAVKKHLVSDFQFRSVSSSLFVISDFPEKTVISLYNSLGIKLAELNSGSCEDKREVLISNSLKPGIYIVRINLISGSVTRKIAIE